MHTVMPNAVMFGWQHLTAAFVAIMAFVAALKMFFFNRDSSSVESNSIKSSSSSQSRGSLSPSEYRPFKLVSKENISYNVRLFRFGLPSSTSVLGLPVGQHLYLQAIVDGEQLSRPYTPTSSDDDLGYFDLLIKVYPNGKMTKHLDAMDIGSSILAKGPLGKFTYKGNGSYVISGGRAGRLNSIGMLAGGTGITPMMQIVRAVMKDEADQTEINLVFGNLSEKDILLRDELQQYEKQFPSFNCYHCLNESPEGWQQGIGFVTREIIEEQMPAPADDTMILLCGPLPFVSAMHKILLSMDYTRKMIFKF